MTAASTPLTDAAPRPSRPSARMTALRGAFAALDRVAPSLGARWALRIWCTLPRGASRRRDSRPPGGARSELVTAQGWRLAVESWGDGAPVYLVHGWGGWRGQLGAFVAPLVDAGYRVVAFDAPGHGDSGPGALGAGRGSAAELAHSLTAVIERHGAAAGVVGHSLGGTAAALAIHDGAPVARLALVAPSPDPIALTDDLATTLGYGARTHRRFLARLERLAQRPLTDFDLTASGAVPAPTLIVHDRGDREVAYTEGLRLAAAWPAAEFHTTSGLGHQRILTDRAVIDDLCRFVTATPTPMPG